jgi:uncharacterized repeat protein (TIGR03803 family)
MEVPRMHVHVRLAGSLAVAGILLAGCGSDDHGGPPPPTATPVLAVLHAFAGSDGAWSRGSLTAVGTTLYGRTAIGGTANSGTIFQIGEDGSGFQSLYSFTAGGDNGLGNQPHHNAMLTDGSLLIGAALYGGNTMNTSLGAVLHSKPPEPPAPKVGNGTLFTIGTDGTDYAVLLELDGGALPALPHSPPMLAGDGVTLYGMTAGGGAHLAGTLYTMQTSGAGLTILHSFKDEDGDEPHGIVVFDSTGTKLLGMTRKGGTPADSTDTAAGVIFSYDLGSATYDVLHTFVADSASNGATNDHGFLTLVDGVAYGTTEDGGKHQKGTLFSIHEDGSHFQLVHSFKGAPSDGKKPFGSLLFVDGWLYGTTTEGGATDDGTVFRLHVSDGKYEVLASFDRATTGAFPEDNVTLSSDGRLLFGLTQAGGVNDPNATNYYGTVFSVEIP